MANENKKEKLPEPSFNEQMNGEDYSEDNQDANDPVFSHAYHKFMVNLLTTRDKAVKEELIKAVGDVVDQRILKTLQSDELANKVAEKVRADVAETYLQLAASLQGIEVSISTINERLNKEDEKIKLEAERLDLRIDLKRDLIKDLRNDFEINKKKLEEIALHKPTLETIQKVFTFWTWKKNWLKIASIILAILFLFVMMLVGVVYYMHKKGWVTENMGNKHSYNVNDIYSEMRTGGISSITRGAKSTLHYTDVQRDSIIRINQQNIQIGIDKRNADYNKLAESWRSKK